MPKEKCSILASSARAGESFRPRTALDHREDLDIEEVRSMHLAREDVQEPCIDIAGPTNASGPWADASTMINGDLPPTPSRCQRSRATICRTLGSHDLLVRRAGRELGQFSCHVRRQGFAHRRRAASAPQSPHPGNMAGHDDRGHLEMLSTGEVLLATIPWASMWRPYRSPVPCGCTCYRRHSMRRAGRSRRC